MGKREAVSCGFEQVDESLYTYFSTCRQPITGASKFSQTDAEAMTDNVDNEKI